LATSPDFETVDSTLLIIEMIIWHFVGKYNTIVGPEFKNLEINFLKSLAIQPSWSHWTYEIVSDTKFLQVPEYWPWCSIHLANVIIGKSLFQNLQLNRLPRRI
jgi:hypothetical protein